jgi:hypothetical protein
MHGENGRPFDRFRRPVGIFGGSHGEEGRPLTILLAAERPERVGGHDAAWALLRLAAARLGSPPCRRSRAPPGEKPRSRAGRLFFSLSHTRTHVLCALADRDVGADSRRAARSRTPARPAVYNAGAAGFRLF